MIRLAKLERVLVVVLAVGLAACDVTDVRDREVVLEVINEPISLGPDVGRVAVMANASTASSSIVQNDLGIVRVEELRKIGLDLSSFTFTAGKAAQGNGTITVVIVFNGVPLPEPVLLTVRDFAVTQASPAEITFGGNAVHVETIERVLGAVPENQRPVLKAWQTMTLEQIAAEINAGLASASFPLAVAIETAGDLTGALKLNEFKIDALLVLR